MLRLTYCRIALLCSLLLAFFYNLPFWITHPELVWADQSVYLGMAQLLIQGKVPYLDFFDFNFPIIIYLNAVPALIARVTNSPVPIVLDLCVFALMAFSLALCHWVVLRSGSRVLYFSQVPWLFALIIFTQAQWCDFSQREHIFVLMIAPYLLLRCVPGGLKGRGRKANTLPYLIGALASIGTNIKPQFFIIWLSFELMMVVCARASKSETSWKNLLIRPETKAFALGTAIYVLHFALYPMEAMRILFQEAIPIYMGGSAWFAKTLISSLTCDNEHFVPVELFVLALGLALPNCGRSPLIGPLIAFSCASFFAYLSSGGTYSYRLLSVEGGALLLLASLAGIVVYQLRRLLLQQWFIVKYLLTVSVALATASVAVGAWSDLYRDAQDTRRISLVAAGYNWTSHPDFSAAYYSVLKHSQIGEGVIFMGTGVRPGYPTILQSNRRPASRYLHGMIIPMLGFCLDVNHDKRFYKVLDRVVANYGQDILKNKPRLIYMQPGFFDEAIEKDFVTTYLANYKVVGFMESMDMRLYKRQDQPEPIPQVVPVKEMPEEGKRAQLLKVLIKQITADECADKLNETKEDVEKEVARLRIVIDDELSNTVGGREEELDAKLRRTEEEKLSLEKQVDRNHEEMANMQRRLDDWAAGRNKQK